MLAQVLTARSPRPAINTALGLSWWGEYVGHHFNFNASPLPLPPISLLKVRVIVREERPSTNANGLRMAAFRLAADGCVLLS